MSLAHVLILAFVVIIIVGVIAKVFYRKKGNTEDGSPPDDVYPLW